MSLFEGKDILRQPDKPQLAEALRNYVKTKSDNAVTQTVPVTEHYVLDGGSFLHRLKWTEGTNYSSIRDDYASFTVKHWQSNGRVWWLGLWGWTKYMTNDPVIEEEEDDDDDDVLDEVLDEALWRICPSVNPRGWKLTELLFL